MTQSDIEQKVNRLVRLLLEGEGNDSVPRKPSKKELRKMHYHNYLDGLKK